jgi:hypothetical protein
MHRGLQLSNLDKAHYLVRHRVHLLGHRTPGRALAALVAILHVGFREEVGAGALMFHKKKSLSGLFSFFVSNIYASRVDVADKEITPLASVAARPP